MVGRKDSQRNYFPEIDTVLRRRGASLVVWSTKPFPMPDEVPKGGTYPDPVKRGIAAENRVKMYGQFNRPVAKGDLRAVILKCRRPELYER